jgi:hypothetical protein
MSQIMNLGQVKHKALPICPDAHDYCIAHVDSNRHLKIQFEILRKDKKIQEYLINKSCHYCPCYTAKFNACFEKYLRLQLFNRVANSIYSQTTLQCGL